MSKNNTLVDLSDGTAVSSNSPQSPITLDFDPMSFQFKEDSPLTSPSDNNHELDALCSSQNVDDFFDPFCPVKEESPTDYYPNIMLGDLSSQELLARENDFVKSNSNEDPLTDMHDSEACNSLSTTTTSSTITVTAASTKIREAFEVGQSGDLLGTDSFSQEDSATFAENEIQSFSTAQEVDLLCSSQEACVFEPETESVDGPLNDDSLHVTDQDEVFQHEECQLPESDLSRRGKISSVSSSRSSRSERSEKKTLRKTSSTSSENSLREEEVKVTKVSTTSKSSKVEEASIQAKNVEHESKTVSDKNSKSEVINYHAVNGIDKSASLKCTMDEKGVLSAQEQVLLPECPVSVSELRSTYVHQTDQESSPVSPSKELIETGIDIKSLKSSFSVSDEENQPTVIQEEVKPSVDRAKVQRTFSQESFPTQGSDDLNAADEKISQCKICEKTVYEMEKLKALKSIFHKQCFRCKECNKLLTIDTYQSHEGSIYCKLHFKQLTEPKARFDGEDGAPTCTLYADDFDSDTGKQRRNELIIRENVPAELSPDVVRSDSKPDHGLENIPVNLNNLKSKFETYREEHHLPSTTDVCTLQRSASVMARLAKYQSAVSGDNENGDVSESESEEESEDPSVIKPTKHKEKVVFSGMSSLKSQWETGSVVATKEEKIEEKKEELNKLRQRMCLGRSESMKAVYEKACQDSNKGSATRTESVVLGREVKATQIKEKFEKGELVNEVEEEKMEKARKEKEEDLSVFTEPGMANDAKKLFQQIDANVKVTSITPTSPNKSPMNERKKTKEILYTNQSSVNEVDVVKCSEPTAKEDIPVDTTDVSQRFKFFENYSDAPKERKRFQITPPREVVKEDMPEKEVSHDPSIIRSADISEEIPITDTTRRMLHKFKALEKETPPSPAGPKPLKRITPPREYTKEDNQHDSSPEPERDPNIIRASYKADDDIVVEADKAKSLRAKFENWDIEQRENQKNEEDEEDFLPQVDTTKTLRAKFEAIKEDTLKPLEKPKPKVNRFIQEQQTGSSVELCSICEKKVYPMEKMEASGMKLHKNCFRCAHCGCMLRLENYTTSVGKLYCTPHFKQLFISRGNYDEGFGREQHKEKWNRSSNNTPTPRDLHENGDFVEYTNGDVQCLEERV